MCLNIYFIYKTFLSPIIILVTRGLKLRSRNSDLDEIGKLYGPD